MVIRRWHYPYREGRDLSLERHRSNVGRERGMRGGKEQEKVRLNYNATFLCNFKLYVFGHRVEAEKNQVKMRLSNSDIFN